MKTTVKIIVFVVAAIIIWIIFAITKSSLHNAGKPAPIMWIASGIIFILIMVLFRSKSDNSKSDKDDVIP